MMTSYLPLYLLAIGLPLVLASFNGFEAIPGFSVDCDFGQDFEDCGEDPGEDPGGGGGDGPDCPSVSPDGRFEFSCWTMNSVARCAEQALGIGRQVYERDIEDSDGDDDTDEWVGNHTERLCLTHDDVGLDPWAVYAGVNVSSGSLGTELPGTEEAPILTGYENGFWFEGDTEAFDSDSSVDTRFTGFTATVEVRAWPSEISIDTGDDGPRSGDAKTSTFELETDEFGEVMTGSEDDPLFTHMFETKATHVGHECACFIAELDATWSGEYRWSMGGVTTGWESFDHQVDAEPSLVALQVWEVISRLSD